ncbi:MFS transporter [Actinomadura gamaensis]|uniref:MFS transporter n=1 Tax=Actinomadura gamaensis TaxID=1763541 RepID=A0ABV9U8E4_9ACTN
MGTPTYSERPRTIRSLIPARIDRLPWSPFHTRMVIALGTAWVLEGLEITVASAVAGTLSESAALGMSSTQVGALATVYLVGEVVGALFFGSLADRMGRRKLFMVTLAVYLTGSGLTALTLGSNIGWLAYMYATRFVAGMGIGGEYSAMHSAIDELIPARYRGRVDIGISGTYWGGAILGTLGTLLFLNALPTDVGWRLGFLLGPVLAIVILFVRRHLPESPRWQVMHGREREAEASIAYIEGEVRQSGRKLANVPADRAIEIHPTTHHGYLALLKVLFSQYPSRSVLGASLMITQSFLYNAIFFTYTLVLTKIYGVAASAAPWYLIAFAIGNLTGPLVLGPLFDTVGRRKMISGTYLLSGLLLAASAWLFYIGVLNATTQTIMWCVIFFFASAGASSAYLTVSELFPVEVRAQAIAVFFAIAQSVGALGPVLYGALIGDGTSRGRLFVGYLLAALIMCTGAFIELTLGVDAEGRSLEDVTTPLSSAGRAGKAVSESPGLAAHSAHPPAARHIDGRPPEYPRRPPRPVHAGRLGRPGRRHGHH